MNDTTRRFLTAIVERVPADGRIVELRLFPAIRQGGMESAVAVVAVELAEPAVGVESPEAALAATESVDPTGDPSPALGAVRAEGTDDARVVQTLGNEIREAYARVVSGPGAADPRDTAPDEVEPGADASVADASGADASGADLAGADLAGADLAGADAAGADLAGADAAGADAAGADAAGADAAGADESAAAAPDAATSIAGVDDSDAPAHWSAVTADYALAAHELVDTDVTAEDEEGGGGADVDRTLSFVPHADETDNDAVGDALDEELHMIVVNAARDVVAAEARAFAAAAGTHPGVNLDEVGGESLGPSLEPSLADSPYADAPLPAQSTHREIPADVASPRAAAHAPDVMRLADILALSSPEGVAQDERAVPSEDAAVANAPIHRYAILTASYRLTLKGPDRGKWDVELTHEADAPLATVERVARGVAKRAGEESQPEHFSGESLRQALDAPAWVTTP